MSQDYMDSLGGPLPELRRPKDLAQSVGDITICIEVMADDYLLEKMWQIAELAARAIQHCRECHQPSKWYGYKVDEQYKCQDFKFELITHVCDRHRWNGDHGSYNWERIPTE